MTNFQDAQDPYDVIGEETHDQKLDRMDSMLDGVLNLIEKNAQWRKIYKLHYTARATAAELAATEKLTKNQVHYILKRVVEKARKLFKKPPHIAS